MWRMLACLLLIAIGGTAMSEEQECVLDRTVNIPADLARAVPEVAPLCDGLPGLHKCEVAVDAGGRLYCETEGAGVPLVLVSGGPGCTHHLFHPYFSAAAGCAQVIYYDQRGVGQSSRDDTHKTYTIKQAVADLDALRERLGIERWIVLGHSYGGFLAQCYALEHPGRVMGLVLVCASPGHLAMKPSRQREYLTQAEADAIQSVWNNQALTPEQALFNKELAGDWKRQSFYRPTEEQAARMARYEWRPAPGFRDTICPDMNPLEVQGAFAGFEPPTLLVESTHDLTWNTDKPGMMPQIHPRATLVMMEHSAHRPFADEPEAFFAALRQFVAAARAAPAVLPVDAPSRMPWPPAIQADIDALPWQGAGDRALDLFHRAQQEHITHPPAWFCLALRLYDDRHYQEALAAFAECTRLAPDSPDWGLAAWAWQGMILDLQGKREAALQRYESALKVPHPGSMNHGQYRLTIDEGWVRERLKTPFERAGG